MITTFEKICALNIYVIVLRPIFNTTTKGKSRSKYTCDISITNWSYSNKLGIVFTIYQRMISKGTSWAGTRHVIIFTWNDVRGSFLMLRMSGGRGTNRSRFWSGNAADLWFIAINRVLVGVA